jgi:hypothetical protein
MINPTRAHRLTLPGLVPIAIASCVLDGQKLEENIKEKLKSDGVELTSVDCPRGKKASDTTAFDCKATTSAGSNFTVRVTPNGKGDIQWEPVGKIVRLPDFSAQLGGQGSKVDCGTDTIIAVKGTKVTCKAMGESHDFTFKNDEGDLEP